MTQPTVYLIVCGAGPAPFATKFITAARTDGWDCHVITTPSGEGFINPDSFEAASGRPVVSQHRRPGTPRRGRPPADAVVIAPATANTINKLAAGISDTYALDVASECMGLGIPTIIVPFVNSALANRLPYRKAIESLKKEHVLVLDVSPHEPHQGGRHIADFPWAAAHTTAKRLVEDASG